MAGRANEAIIPEVRHLITQLTKFQEGEENFDLCERFALSNLWHHRFLSVDSHAVRRSVEGIVTKFEIHGHFDTSRKLAELVNAFLSDKVFHDHPQFDIQWSLLSLLLHLADNPTTFAYRRLTAPVTLQVTHEEDKFDWTSYLREGDERFTCVYDDTSSEEDFSSDSEEKANEELAAFAVPSLEPLMSEVQPEKSYKEGIIKNLKDIYSAEEWLKLNVQRQYWTCKETCHSTQSKYPTANLAKIWNQYLVGHDLPQTSTLSEYKIIREILWMLYTPTSTYLFKEDDRKFSVKSDITIPSLTKDVTIAYLNHLCPFFAMLKEFQSFGEELNSSSCTNLPPNTYLAYWTAIKEFLSEFNTLIVTIEMKVKKQDEVYTLLSLRNELEPKLVQLRHVYSIHTRGVYSWKTTPNWLSASCLLSVLYGEMLHSSNGKQTAIMLKLFLKSFQVYLDIIDTWFTNGQLQDSRNEFVISRNECDEEYVVQPYESHLDRAGVQPLPVLQKIVDRILHAGKSIDLLLRLNRLSELQLAAQRKGFLYEELVVCIEKDLFHFVDKPLDTSECTVSAVAVLENDANNFLTDIRKHLFQDADPFLIEGFESYFCLMKNRHKKENHEEEFTKNLKRRRLYARVMQYFENEVLPIKPVLETNLLRLVEEKCKAACCMVKPIFQHEFNLIVHFQMIRSIFLMEAGDLMHQFYTSFFEQVQSFEANSFSLSLQLESCVDLRYPRFSSRFSVVVDNSMQFATSIQDAIDSLKIRYAVEWPVSLVLSEKHMQSYNTVFQFLLKIKWAIFSLEKLRFSDLEQRKDMGKSLSTKEKARVQRLQFLRFWLLHSVNSIHNYLMGQVLHFLSLELERRIDEAEDLDALIEAHSEYVQMVYAHCFQSEGNKIKSSILQMIWAALRMCEVWEAGVVRVSDARLQELEDLYCKCHVFLAFVLSSCVENDSTSHLAGLYAAFDTVHLHQRFLAAITID